MLGIFEFMLRGAKEVLRQSEDSLRLIIDTKCPAGSRLGGFPNDKAQGPSSEVGALVAHILVVREYLIAYAPEEKPLWVIAIMHGRRSPRVMAAILRGRE